MKKPSAKMIEYLPYHSVATAVTALLVGFVRHAGAVVELLGSDEYYRLRVIDFMSSGAFIPNNEYERAKNIMGSHFSGVQQAFQSGLTFRHRDLEHIQKIPFTEETLTRCAGTHFLVLVPRGVHTSFRDSPDDVIKNPEEYIRESLDTGWHWILYRVNPLTETYENEELVSLFDALYTREVHGVTHYSPLKVGNTFKSNGDQVVLVPLESGQYGIRHPGNDELRSCTMVKPDKV